MLDREIQIAPLNNAVLKFDDTFDVISTKISVEGETYPVDQSAIDELLELLNIPKKYWHRIKDINLTLAQDNVNAWLNNSTEISAVISDGRITDFTEANREFLSISTVREFVAQHLEISTDKIIDQMDGDIYIGTFILPGKSYSFLDGTKASIAIRLQFSDSFKIIPRIDYQVIFDNSFDSLVYGIKGRKMRVTGATSTQILNQITEFCDLVQIQGERDFLSALDNAIAEDYLADIAHFMNGLTKDLRLSKKLVTSLIDDIEDKNLVTFCRVVEAKLAPEIREDIDIETSRSIEMAISNYILSGEFK